MKMASITQTTPRDSATLSLTAADAVWIGTAMLHERYPDAAGFTPAAIQEEVLGSHLTSVLPKTIYQHIVQHVTATQPANPNRRRMLTEVSDGLRRLYLDGDDFHPSRNGAQSKPKPEDLPPQLRGWLDWYEGWSRVHPGKRAPAPTLDPLEALAGTWTFGDADTYVRELREGWESR
jgi:hypothetical protein